MKIDEHGTFCIHDGEELETMFDGTIQTPDFIPDTLDITTINNQKAVTFNVITPKIKPDLIQPTPMGPTHMVNTSKIQKRKHHKTRINKKWLKKYGYKIIGNTYKLNWLKVETDDNISTFKAEVIFKKKSQGG